MCFPKASRVIACAVPFISLSPHWTNAIVSGSFLRHFISEATDDGTDRSPYFSSAACHFHLPLPVTNWNVSACSDPIIHNDFSAIARCSVSYISFLGLIFFAVYWYSRCLFHWKCFILFFYRYVAQSTGSRNGEKPEIFL